MNTQTPKWLLSSVTTLIVNVLVFLCLALILFFAPNAPAAPTSPLDPQGIINFPTSPAKFTPEIPATPETQTTSLLPQKPNPATPDSQLLPPKNNVATTSIPSETAATPNSQPLSPQSPTTPKIIILTDPTPLITGFLDPFYRYTVEITDQAKNLIVTANITTGMSGFYLFEPLQPLNNGSYNIRILDSTENITASQKFSLYSQTYESIKITRFGNQDKVENDWQTPNNVGKISKTGDQEIHGLGEPDANIIAFFDNVDPQTVTTKVLADGTFTIPIPAELKFGSHLLRIVQQHPVPLLTSDIIFQFELVNDSLPSFLIAILILLIAFPLSIAPMWVDRYDLKHPRFEEINEEE